MHYQGNILKLMAEHTDVVRYYLPIGNELVDMNSLIGKEIELRYFDLVGMEI